MSFSNDGASEAVLDTWDQVAVEKGLAHIERLQNQLEGLRSAIPSLLQPFAAQDTTKVPLAVSMQKAAIQTTTTFKDFRQQWSAKETQDVLARASQSLNNNPDLSKAADVPAWGWEKS